jgi:hypothetical protein
LILGDPVLPRIVVFGGDGPAIIELEADAGRDWGSKEPPTITPFANVCAMSIGNFVPSGSLKSSGALSNRTSTPSWVSAMTAFAEPKRAEVTRQM